MRHAVTLVAPVFAVLVSGSLAACGDSAATADTAVADTAVASDTTATTATDSATTASDDTAVATDAADTASPDAADTHDPNDPCQYVFSSNVSYLTKLAIASLGDDSAGPPADDCCFDFSGDSDPDNRMGEIVKLTDGLPQIKTKLNDIIAANIADGTLTVLVELVGADDFGAASNATLNVFYGSDTDSDQANNVAGQGTFTASLSSFASGTATPATTFGGVIVTNGNLFAGPSTFHMSLPLSPSLVVAADIERTRIEGKVAAGASGGFTVSGGAFGAKLGGIIPEQSLFDAFNGFAASRCGCLSLGGASALIEKKNGEWQCAASIDTSACHDDIDVERQCKTVASICGVALAFITPDIDSDGVGGPDAFSVGAWIEGVGAQIVGVEPAECTPGP